MLTNVCGAIWCHQATMCESSVILMNLITGYYSVPEMCVVMICVIVWRYSYTFYLYIMYKSVFISDQTPDLIWRLSDIIYTLILQALSYWWTSILQLSGFDVLSYCSAIAFRVMDLSVFLWSRPWMGKEMHMVFVKKNRYTFLQNWSLCVEWNSISHKDIHENDFIQIRICLHSMAHWPIVLIVFPRSI